jgi:hypothetical protein
MEIHYLVAISTVTFQEGDDIGMLDRVRGFERRSDDAEYALAIAQVCEVNAEAFHGVFSLKVALERQSGAGGDSCTRLQE